LKNQELIEERRTCYVAMTRTRKRLYVSGAHWYGETQKPKDRSVFFEELADWGETTGRATVDRGPQPDPDNPLVGYRERLVRNWPGPALSAPADALFEKGWRRAAATAVRAGGVDAAELIPRGLDPAEVRAAAEPNRSLATHLLEREAKEKPALWTERELGPSRPWPPGRPRWMPASIAVGGIIDYARCPKRFYWSAVRPLPRFSGPAARIGTEIHKWIERRSSGQSVLIELEEQPDLTPEELAQQPGKMERLRQAFLESRFAQVVPLYTERPFLLHVDGSTVSGRIDAVYELPGGRWEVVDYKTGQPPAEGDPLQGLQLDLYALACVEVWRKSPEDLVLTYFYLSSEQEVSRPAEDPATTRARVVDYLRGIANGAFDPTPGDQCRWCDFLTVCGAGQEHVAAVDAVGEGR